MQRSKAATPWLLMLLLLAWLVPAQAAELPDFTALAEDASPAVVNISTVKTVDQNEQLREFFRQHPRGEGGPFDEFFDQFDRFFGNRKSKPQQQRSLGSGFIISEDGYIVTNNHVIANADEVSVTLRDDEHSIDAVIVGRDTETDLALLKIDVDHPLDYLEFGDAEHLKVGEWVLAIGNPFGLGHTVTAGIISAKGRVIGAGPFDDFLQTDASINPGNSGGPLVNMNGKVVGINTAIVASGQGIGFAVPSYIAKSVIDQLRQYKSVKRGWLGVTIQDVDESMAKALGLPKAEGALVSNVRDGDPAAKAGIKTSDVILQVNGKDVADSSALLRAIAGLAPGEKVDLQIWRNGKRMNLTATLGERDTETLAQMGGQGDQEQAAPEGQSLEALGLSIRPVDQKEAKALDMDKAQGLIVVEVQDDSPASKADLRPGDVVLEANQQPVDTVEALTKQVEAAKDKGVIMLLVRRQGQNLFRTIDLEAKGE